MAKMKRFTTQVFYYIMQKGLIFCIFHYRPMAIWYIGLALAIFVAFTLSITSLVLFFFCKLNSQSASMGCDYGKSKKFISSFFSYSYLFSSYISNCGLQINRKNRVKNYDRKNVANPFRFTKDEIKGLYYIL